MHFWINKGSQGRGFNGRYVPPSISAGSRRNEPYRSTFPKPMVTPVHRFQSIESVASGGHRHSRGPHYHARFPAPQQSHHCFNHATIPEISGPGGASRSSGTSRTRRQSHELITIGENNALTTAAVPRAQTSRLKCGIWVLMGLIPFFIAAAKYYISGQNLGIEALTFCSVLLILLIIGGLMSVFDQAGAKRERRESVQISSEQNETFEDSSQVPSSVTPIHAELPPPPYHVAVMLPSQNTIGHHITLIQDSPPPTYEKAVT